ncbi:MarR family winged helix-turn-helix transcriptional regulator [Tautonia sociabilis]|uniref:MarR family transcriptional regulator n=1 Tax=Tautonia sociabilis TaxID=2080755 RepID=A0A432MEX7_9BACT|nr:MarR family transcriptional regulator [Tautonia sociabilis]RUL84231.1 MarR family transcriptional regulator [Tautonia sociabilis]
MARAGLQHELKKREPFAVPEQEAMLNLMRTADVLQLEFVRLFRRHGLSPAQYNILRILRGEGGEGLPSLEIASRMITSVPDITRLVDRLEAAGLVTRDRSARDRRVVRVRVTSCGLERLRTLDEPVLTLHRRLLGHLESGELRSLNELLVKARHPPERDTPAPSSSGPTGSRHAARVGIGPEIVSESESESATLTRPDPPLGAQSP